MAHVDDFILTPSDMFFYGCTKEQLQKTADHYDTEIINVLLSIAGSGVFLPLPQSSATVFLFNQERELLLLQMGHEKLKHQVQVEK